MAKLTQIITLVLLFFFFGSDLYCQIQLEVQFQPPNCRFDNFPVKNGEANETSTCVMTDKNGFIWSGTETGLYRFDGKNYLEYRISESDNKGFKGNIVTCLYEDSGGYIWAGTTSALNCLDQKTGTFRSYQPDSSGIAGGSNLIRHIHQDTKGILWIMTNRHFYSLNKITGEFTEYKLDSLKWQKSDAVYMDQSNLFLCDQEENIWIATRSGIYKYDRSDTSFLKVFPVKGDTKEQDYNINCITESNEGVIYFGTNKGGLYRWDKNRERPEKINLRPDLAKNGKAFAVTAILCDPDGAIWAFSDRAFSRYEPFSDDIRNYEFNYSFPSIWKFPDTPYEITDAFYTSDRNIWFVDKSLGLVFRFNESSSILSLYRVPNFIVYQCVMDSEESFWFACVRNNLYRLVTRNLPFHIVPIQNSTWASQGNMQKIIEDRKNNIWFMFNNGIFTIRHFDPNSSFKLGKFKLPDGDSLVSMVNEDSEGNIWFAARSGRTARYNPENTRFTIYPPDATHHIYPFGVYRVMQEDKDGNLWFGSIIDGFYIYSLKTRRFESSYGYKDLFKNKDLQWLADFHIDSEGYLWFLGYDYLHRLKMDDHTVTNFTGFRKDGYPDGSSYINVKEDKKGRIWVLNNIKGLFLFDRASDKFVPVELPGEMRITYFLNLFIDIDDRLWISNNSGISVYNYDSGSIRNIKTPKLQFDIHGAQISSGNIFYVNENRLYIFKREIPFNDVIPPVFITGVMVNGERINGVLPYEKSQDKLNRIVLKYVKSSFIIEFASLNYLEPWDNQFKYKMSGIDIDTVYSGTVNRAEYKNMQPGKYIFWVTGSNNDRIWNKEGIALEIIIRAPFYRTWVAYFFYALISATLLVLYIRYRISNLSLAKARLEAEVQLRNEELILKNRQLEEMDRLKTKFFTNISHEIRTPLALILGPLDKLVSGYNPGKKGDDLIDMMKRNGQRIMQLVGQMLDISRLDAGKMKIMLSESDLTLFLKMLVYEFVSYAESKKIRYLVELPDKTFFVLFDRDKLEKIIANILSNAFKYTEEGGVVSFDSEILNADTKNDSPVLRFTVKDTGEGINSEHLDKIFERFYRIEKSSHDIHEGTGIGLSLVKELISLHKGNIDVKSEPGRGSEFSVTIPLGVKHLKSEEYLLVDPEERIGNIESSWKWKDTRTDILASGGKNEKKRILVIEDNNDLRKFIKSDLENEFEVYDAENGSTGLKLCMTSMPDLIITDLRLPDMDGIDICEKIKNDETTSHIPIIILTARASVEDKISGLKSGSDDYITKPFNMSELKVRISNLLIQREKLMMKYRNFRTLFQPEGGSVSIDDKFMGKVMSIINSNLNDFDFDVTALQNNLGISRMHLFRKLKVLTGVPPVIFLRNIRLEKAAILLGNKTGNITQIANSVGFSSPSYFTRCFREYFGVSPKDYIKSNNDKKNSFQ